MAYEKKKKRRLNTSSFLSYPFHSHFLAHNILTPISFIMKESSKEDFAVSRTDRSKEHAKTFVDLYP
jgi:hypothetical protein